MGTEHASYVAYPERYFNPWNEACEKTGADVLVGLIDTRLLMALKFNGYPSDARKTADCVRSVMRRSENLLAKGTVSKFF